MIELDVVARLAEERGCTLREAEAILVRALESAEERE